MNSCVDSVEAPFATSAGLALPVPRLEDPYRALDELMVVVEMLCPVWPERETFNDRGRMLL